MSKNGQTAAVLPTQDPEKLAKIQRELDHLAEIFKDVNPNKRDFVQRQIEQLSWLNVSIADLQAKVDQWGTLIMYDNGGGQSGVKPNPDVKTLLDYQKTCNTIVRTLIPLVPDKYVQGKLADLRAEFDIDDDTPVDWDERKRQEDEHLRQINEEIARAAEQARINKEEWERKHGKR